MVSISNTIFAENTANNGPGAGAHLYASEGASMDAYLDKIDFVQNTGGYYTGLRVKGNVFASIYQSAFIGNTAQNIALDPQTCIITSCILNKIYLIQVGIHGRTLRCI
jgi:hypothetical protein